MANTGSGAGTSLRTLSSLPAGDGEHGFLDLGHGIMSDLLEFDMRYVWHLVGGYDGVDDRRAIDGEGLGDCGHQLVRLSRHESVTATGACQRCKIGIGKFDGFAEWHEADAFGLQRDQPERGIVVDDDLD